MSELTNEDLAPVPQEQRTWNTLNYFSLWVGMAVCIPSYMIAASLISAGMSLWQAVGCVFLGNMIVLVPMVLNGMVGAKYGIPYPVFARSSFGILGSNVPALLRAVVACGWFGIQSWIGGMAVMAVIKTFWPGFVDLPNILPAFMGTTTAPFISFLIFWSFNVFIILKGVQTIKWFETASAPLLLVSGVALLLWAVFSVGEMEGSVGAGLTKLMDQPSKFETSAAFWKVFIPSLTGMVGFWATMSLNIPDFTRYAKDQRSQFIGQIVGLPTTMTLFALIGVVVTNATVILFGKAIWDPVQVIERFDSPILLFISMVIISIATLSTNIAANVVGPANDFANAAPSKINFKRGGLLTAFLGIVMMPWKLIADPTGYVFTWLIGYSSLLGPIGGILLTDYFIVRKQTLKVEDLYKSDGEYTYFKGFNFAAIIAFVVGVIPNVPGFLHQIGVTSSISPFFETIYSYAWFVGLPLAGVIYFAMMKFNIATKRRALNV
ncbi:MAG: NCS1 family nucleobase:cation symporter-1 [Bacteriovoracaceae bacterium]|nr:NCS1 family nucleobase:cation symporter-1 [Bacteriovoracaceae bacterium]